MGKSGPGLPTLDTGAASPTQAWLLHDNIGPSTRKSGANKADSFQTMLETGGRRSALECLCRSDDEPKSTNCATGSPVLPVQEQPQTSNGKPTREHDLGASIAPKLVTSKARSKLPGHAKPTKEEEKPKRARFCTVAEELSVARSSAEDTISG